MGSVVLVALLAGLDGADAATWETQVRAFLDGHEQLLPCAAAPLKGLPTIEVRVEPDGSVGIGGVATDSTPPTAACVLEAVRALRLPAPGQQRSLRYTWPHAADVRWRQLRASPLTPADAQAFLAANAAAFERCVGRPSKLVLSVDADGGVLSAKAAKGPAPVCLATVLAELPFPSGSAPAKVSVTAPAPATPTPGSPGEAEALGWRELKLAQALDRPGVTGCYLGLRGTKQAEGRFEVHALIAASGRVLVAQAEPSGGALAGTDVAACAAARVRHWLLPPTARATAAMLTWVGAAASDRVVLFAPADDTPYDAVTVPDSEAGLRVGAPEELRAAVSELEACAALASPPLDGGVFAIDWRPQHDGALADPRARSVAVPQVVVSCALSRLRGVRLKATSATLPHRAARAFVFTERGVELTPVDTALSGLEPDQLQTVLRAHQHEVRFCYEQELQRHPKLGGKVSVSWTVGFDGRVLPSIRTEQEPALDVTGRCIGERMLTWQFPEPFAGQPVDVSFSWFFKAVGED